MSIRVTHAAGDMFASTAKRQSMYATVAATGADVITFSEAAKDHAFLRKIGGYECALVSELAILWRPDRLALLEPAWWDRVMDGGKRGPLGGKSKQRRGPSRYAVVVALREHATDDVWLPATHHAIAKADTSFLWRRPLRTQGFAGFAALIRKARGEVNGFVVATGDWNTKGAVNLGLGLRELRTPKTFGKGLRYDRIQVDPSVHVAGVDTFATVLDHDAVTAVLTGSGEPVDLPAAHPVSVPSSKPRRRKKWGTWRQRRALRRLERRERRGRRLNKRQRRRLNRLRALRRRNR